MKIKNCIKFLLLGSSIGSVASFSTSCGTSSDNYALEVGTFFDISNLVEITKGNVWVSSDALNVKDTTKNINVDNVDYIINCKKEIKDAIKLKNNKISIDSSILSCGRYFFGITAKQGNNILAKSSQLGFDVVEEQSVWTLDGGSKIVDKELSKEGDSWTDTKKWFARLNGQEASEAKLSIYSNANHIYAQCVEINDGIVSIKTDGTVPAGLYYYEVIVTVNGQEVVRSEKINFRVVEQESVWNLYGGSTLIQETISKGAIWNDRNKWIVEKDGKETTEGKLSIDSNVNGIFGPNIISITNGYVSINATNLPVGSYWYQVVLSDGSFEIKRTEKISFKVNEDKQTLLTYTLVRDQLVEEGKSWIVSLDSSVQKQSITNISIPSSHIDPASSFSYPVTKMADGIFEGCSSLVSISLPTSLRSVSSNAFLNCTSLLEVNFNGTSDLKTIGESAFSGCSKIKIIDIPASVASIDNSAFENCSELKILYIRYASSSSPLDFPSNDPLKGCDKLETIYVSSSLIEQYKTATGWSKYIDILKPICVL